MSFKFRAISVQGGAETIRGLWKVRETTLATSGRARKLVGGDLMQRKGFPREIPARSYVVREQRELPGGSPIAEKLCNVQRVVRPRLFEG